MISSVNEETYIYTYILNRNVASSQSLKKRNFLDELLSDFLVKERNKDFGNQELYNGIFNFLLSIS